MNTPSQRIASLLAARTAVEARRAARDAAGDARLPERLAAMFHRDLRRDPRAAARATRAVRALASVTNRPETDALALRLEGVLAHVQGDARTARRLLERAASITADPRAAGDVQRILIEVLVPLGDIAAARRAHAKATRCYARVPRLDPRRRADLANSLGNLHHHVDRHDDALAAYAEARRWFARAGEPLRLAYVDHNRANILATRGRTAAARVLYERALRRYRRERQGLLVAQAEYALAGLDLLEGRLDAALDAFERLVTRQRELGDAAGVAHTELDAADALLRLNRPLEAERAAANAAAWFARAAQPGPRAAADAARAGAALQQGRARTAATLFTRAARGCRQLGNPAGSALYETGLAQALLASGRAELASKRALAAAAVLERHALRARAARALVVAADAALVRGHVRRATTLVERALKLARGSVDARVRLAALLVAARAADRADDHAAAYRLLRRGARLVEQLRAGVTSEDSRLAFALDKEELYESLVLNRLRRGDRRSVLDALDWAEQGKARLLADRLASGRLAGLVGRGSRAKQLLARLDQLDRELAVAEARVEAAEGPSGLRRASAAEHVTLTAARSRVLQQLEAADAGSASLVAARLPRPEAFLARLAPDETVLEYVIVRGSISLFVLEADRVDVVHDIARADDVADTIAGLRFQLGKGVLGDAHAALYGEFGARAVAVHLARLHRQLLGPVAGRLEGRRVRIVPHGLLHGLPFHAFENDGVPFAERAQVSYAPSLAVLSLLDRAVRPPAGTTALVIGVADERAPAIADEIVAVRGRLRGARVRTGEEATRAALFGAGVPAPVLHVASHGFYREGKSGLKLGDAWLTLQDIYRLPSAAELVVLSGCETGRGTVHSGDEWVGLVRGFLQAGARTVIAALWDVHDRSATETMTDFYTYLGQGFTAARALREAQRAQRARDASPLRWAPFALTGDPEWTLPASARAISAEVVPCV